MPKPMTGFTGFKDLQDEALIPHAAGNDECG
jgi:hypothetical protein